MGLLGEGPTSSPACIASPNPHVILLKDTTTERAVHCLPTGAPRPDPPAPHFWLCPTALGISLGMGHQVTPPAANVANHLHPGLSHQGAAGSLIPASLSRALPESQSPSTGTGSRRPGHGDPQRKEGTGSPGGPWHQAGEALVPRRAEGARPTMIKMSWEFTAGMPWKQPGPDRRRHSEIHAKR